MQTKQNAIIVIPARLHSTRLPRKLLLRETGQSLLEHTYQQATASKRSTRTIIATDHTDIANDAKRFSAECVLTDPNAQSGTDRVAEVAAKIDDADIVVNVQGDEPEIAPESIDHVIDLLASNPDSVMSTLATPIRSEQQLNDPNCVKVVVGSNGNAAYFSRSPIPYVRDQNVSDLLDHDPPIFLQHVGLYAYRRSFLLKLAAMPASPLEKLEKLEQLRVLEAGHAIRVGVVDEPTFGIDTEEDYRVFVSRYQRAA